MPTNDKAIITAAAQRYGIDPKILWGLYGTETSFGKNVSTSSAGAVGPFQFEPSTAKGMGVNPYDFKSAAYGAARYLSQYRARGVGGMLSAYNAGPAGGYQAGYVQTTLNNAKSYGGSSGGSIPAPGRSPASPALPRAQASAGGTEVVPNPKAQGLRMLANEERASDPQLADLLNSRAGEGTTVGTPPSLPEPRQGTPAPTPSSSPGGSELGGFLPRGAPLSYRRIDQGQDVQLNPGQALLAPGDWQVVAVKSDPSGFGPDYPVIKFSSGPLAGKSIYLGHTDSLVHAGQSGRAGEPLARTSRTGHNAPPGWAEIGEASALGQGIQNQGARLAPYLRKR